MFLELAKFGSLLLSILSLDALFHAAFLEPGEHLEHRVLTSLEHIFVAGAVCLASGFIFRAWEHRISARTGRITNSFPMMLFWWGTGIMTVLFLFRWLIERYYLGQCG